jgi:dimethylargininase
MTAMHHPELSFGPRLAANPTGTLRSALLVAPSAAIEQASPLAGEPSAFWPRAAEQQAILMKTLRYFGCGAVRLEPFSDDPYGAAAADLAVVFENGIVLMRPLSMTRRAELAPFEAELIRRDVPVAGHLTPPALLEGADVLLAGETAFIGVGARSNALGRAGFAEIARAHGLKTVEVRLASCVQCLRSVAGVLSHDMLVAGPPDMLDHRVFDGFKMIVTERSHSLGAGVLNLGERHVLADLRFPEVVDLMRKAGVRVEAIDLYDFARVGVTPSMLVLDLKRA